ncbi:MAG: hypothetical protein H5T33_05145 [Candidatus Methanosuratus sp.]|nr:hypothetical protein [Candidatus Methanosuratincola sp.]
MSRKRPLDETECSAKVKLPFPFPFSIEFVYKKKTYSTKIEPGSAKIEKLEDGSFLIVRCLDDGTIKYAKINDRIRIGEL